MFMKVHDILGIKSDYEILQLELLERYKTSYQAVLRGDILTGEITKLESVREKQDLITETTHVMRPTYQTPEYNIYFDSITILPRIKDSLESTCVLVDIVSRSTASDVDKLLLATKALILSRNHVINTDRGRIICGESLKPITIKLTKYLSLATAVLDEIEQLINAHDAPKFYRIAHCKICEFHNPCREALIKMDDISLLGGMNPNEVMKIKKKGILSI
jgi:CRISPR/Cas system-associated exonuclease Cas4 (RecB family)